LPPKLHFLRWRRVPLRTASAICVVWEVGKIGKRKESGSWVKIKKKFGLILGHNTEIATF
jgi:uncharacterized ubiquitin-like protein YukD